MSDAGSLLLVGSILGIAAGLSLLAAGFAGYRRAGLVANTATSAVGTLAVGEVRVTGRVEPAELTLTSPLQGRTCVYYRARVREQDGRIRRTVLDDEHAVGFRVRDDSGTIRVFPRGVTWDVPARFEDADGLMGDPPAGLALHQGPELRPAAPTEEELVAELLAVRPTLGYPITVGAERGRRDYEESRIEPGDSVTVVGTAFPFDQLPDPDGADIATGGLGLVAPLGATEDPEVAADLEAARAAGTLEADPAQAWGNAAIAGFGIGRPVRAPELDPGATRPAVADAGTAERFRRTFEIGPMELVLAVGPDRPLLVSLGGPAAAVNRGQDRFIVGLVGAALAIASAVALALALGGVLPW